MVYWLVSLPEQGSADETWRTVQKATGNGDLSTNYKFEMPMDLRVGGLDKLMTLSDDLTRVDVHVEGVVNKIRRQAGELSEEPLTIDSKPVATFVQNFQWDDGKFSLRKPLEDIVKELTDTVAAVDDDLKTKVSEYSATKQQFQAANRKTGGSLAIKDLSSVVPADAVVDTENICTVIVTVPLHGVNEFQASYEKWSDMVVPGSALQVAADNDYSLMRVLVFRKFVDDFKVSARGKQCQTRLYTPEAPVEGARTAEETTEFYRSELDNTKASMSAWCKTSFAEAFSCWIHICAIRLFVESVLRYGLPPKFLGVVIQPFQRTQAKVRKGLLDAVGDDKANMWTSEGGEEMFPYVSYTLNID